MLTNIIYHRYFDSALHLVRIDDLRKSRGLHSLKAFGYGHVYIGPGLRV